jgi:PTS system nitrogen regulatory IIA component
MELADILTEESVVFCTDQTTKTDVLKMLAETAAAPTGLSVDEIYEAIDNREALGSTGLGNGIAVPHGRFPGLPGVVAVFARLIHPVDFDAVDDQPVDLVMMLLAPLGSGADHLKALARVARTLRTDTLIAELRRTEDPAKLHALLTAPIATDKAA